MRPFLDGDALEIAPTALDSLNASEKMIGISSHVEAMRERIPAQIRVERGGIGHSRWWFSAGQGSETVLLLSVPKCRFSTFQNFHDSGFD